MKQNPSMNIVIYGSANFVQNLTEFGLIDEYQLLVHPILLGGGKQLFRQMQHPITLKHLRTQAFSNGVNVLYYEPTQNASQVQKYFWLSFALCHLTEQLSLARTSHFSKIVSENSKGEIVFDHYHVSLSLNYFEKSEVWKNFTVNPIGTAKRLSCCKIEDGTMIRAFDCSRTSIQFSRTQVCEHMRAYRFYRRDYTVQLENEYILPERFKPLRFAFGNFVFITEKDFFFFFQEADSLLLFEFFLQCILCPLLPFFPELIREDLL